jgi:hypothetical protein
MLSRTYHGGGPGRRGWPGGSGGPAGPTEISRLILPQNVLGDSVLGSAFTYYFQKCSTLPVTPGFPEGWGSTFEFIDTPPKEYTGPAFNFRIYFIQNSGDLNVQLNQDVGGKVHAQYFNSGDLWTSPLWNNPGRSFVVTTAFNTLFIGSTATSNVGGTRNIDSIIRFRCQTDSGLPTHVLNAFRILGIEIIYPL